MSETRTQSAPYFHIGILVDDLHAAIERFSAIYGVTFCEPVHAAARWIQPGRPEEQLRLHLTYSNQGPPYIELLESQGDGLYAPGQGEGVHHVGVWEKDCATRIKELEAQGMRLVGTQLTPEGDIIVAYFDRGDCHGTMLEIVNENRRPMMERWFAGGSFED